MDLSLIRQLFLSKRLKLFFVDCQAEKGIREGEYERALEASRKAVVAAEETFFDPTMLAMLYFPEEHTLAVYALPFFPIAFQFLSGVYKEFKSRRSAKVKVE